MEIFENPYFLAVDKPAGWLSVPSRMGAEDSRPCVGVEMEKAKGIRLFPVHRLDLEVTGVLLFAKTPEAHRAASLAFEGRVVRKRYEAWSEGMAGDQFEQDRELIWESVLLRGKKRAFESPHGKPARTGARWLGEKTFEGGAVQRWALEPFTGRSHQLRYELAKRGFPILGDALYGAKRSFGESAIALRAVWLDLSGAKELQKFDLPAKFEASSLEAWEKRR